MERSVRAFFINVLEQEVSEITLTNPNALKEYYELLDCTTIDYVSLGLKISLVLDDEGLLREDKLGAFTLGGQWFSGHGVIVSTNTKGEDVDVPAWMTLSDVIEKVIFGSTNNLPKAGFKIA